MDLRDYLFDRFRRKYSTLGAKAVSSSATPSNPPTSKPPFDADDVREALGFKRGDPNVEVRIIPAGMEARLAQGRGFDLRDLFAALDAENVHPLKKGAPEIDPAADAGEDVTGEDVTGPVTSGVCGPVTGPARDTVVALDAVLDEVYEEVERAMAKHPAGMHSPHEGCAIITEELDELWEVVKADDGRTGWAREEAIQVAAMAVRYVLDLNPHDDRGDRD